MMSDGVAVVTGGASGIGLASARAFLRAGYRVVIADTDKASGARAANALEGAIFVPTNVADEDAVASLFAEASLRGRIRAVHNNAGITVPRTPIHELETETWDHVLGVNLRGSWLVLRQAIRTLRAQGTGGAIVNTASVAGIAANPGGSAYGASKAGLIMLTRVAALENGGAGIRVNAVAPGTILTPLAERSLASRQESIHSGPAPSGRLGKPEEVAEAVLWLASDAASYVNGAVLTIDGGWTTSLPERGS
jgi:NAD(P)-dependent dehydrogenase (short-subunit alcohol dehydrogenase family)